VDFNVYFYVCYRAAELMTRTGQTVSLKVAKQGAFYHGLATLLSQPSPVMQRGKYSQNVQFKFKINDLQNQKLKSSRSKQCHISSLSNMERVIKLV